LEKFDPKLDGADHDWVSIYDESEQLLFLEIDYLNEANNAERFARDFVDINYIHILCMYRELLMPHVLQIIDAPHTGYGICQIVQIDGCEAH